MFKINIKLGFIALNFTVVFFFIYSILGLLSIQSINLLFIVKFLTFIALFFYILSNIFKVFFIENKIKYNINIEDLKKVLLIILSSLLTFYLNVNIGFGPIISSALIGMLGVLIISKYEVEVFCGSFLGMASDLVFITYNQFLIAALLSGIVFVLVDNHYTGMGGKLGAIAFTGSLFVGIFNNSNFLTSSIPSFEISIILLFYAIGGAMLTYILSIRFNYSSVFSSSIVGLLASLILPIFYGDLGNQLALMVFCASFVGMSSEEVLENEFYVLITSLYTGIIFILTSPYFGGLGGKLGMTAFVSVISLRGSLELMSLFRKRNLKRREEAIG